MKEWTIDSKMVTVYPGKENNCPIVYLNTYEDNGEQIYKALQEHECDDFTLVAISGLNWNHDMSPWPVPPISGNDASCTGGADDYLRLLCEKIIPEAESGLPGTILWRGLAGYSLAGLFALYSAYQTDLFSRIASMSGSLWFPGFLEYALSNEMQAGLDCLYLSLGDRECRTRNPYLKSVQKHTEKIAAFYQGKGIDTAFQMNPGNHFQDAVRRTASGILWIIEK